MRGVVALALAIVGCGAPGHGGKAVDAAGALDAPGTLDAAAVDALATEVATPTAPDSEGTDVADATESFSCVPYAKMCHDQDLLICQPDGHTVTLVTTCAPPESCVSGACECIPACSDKVCGPDACGGSCGSCAAPSACDAGACVCAPKCAGKKCGDDGCGGTCGTCTEGQICSAGICSCPPDSCGDTCQPCPAGLVCSGGACVETATGECTNAADAAITGNPKVDLGQISVDCGTGCLGKKDAVACATPCIADKSGLSVPCATCLSAQVDCAISHCISECIGGANKACCECRDKAGCITNFATCSGLPQETCP